MDEIRDAIIAEMKRRGISQRALAKRIGVAAKNVNRWLSPQANPTLRNLERMRTALKSASSPVQS